MSRLHRQFVHWRRRAHDWSARHPRTVRFLERVGCLQVARPVVARGLAIGLFVALTPTVGVQTLLMLVLCALLRGNFVAAFAVSWISNPITFAPLYVTYYLIGQVVVERLFDPLSPLLNGTLPTGTFEAVCLGLGSLLVALPAALAGFLLYHAFARILGSRRAA